MAYYHLIDGDDRDVLAAANTAFKYNPPEVLHAGYHPHGQHDHVFPTAMSTASIYAMFSRAAVQEMVYYQTIDDDDEDLLAAILAASDAAPKYNPELLKGASDQQVL